MRLAAIALALLLTASLAGDIIFIRRHPEAAGPSTVTRTGSAGQTTSSANTGSTSITVPSDATIILAAPAGYNNSADYFCSGTMDLNSVTMAEPRCDDNDNVQGSAFFCLHNPDTGSQTLAWDWGGTGTCAEGCVISYVFYKGADVSSGCTSAVRSSGGEQSADVKATVSTGALTAQSGDMAVGNVSYYDDGSDSSWSGCTELNDGIFNSNGGSLCEIAPSGNVTMTNTPGTNWSAISGVVLQP